MSVVSEWASWTHAWLSAADRQAQRSIELGDRPGAQVEAMLFVVSVRNAVLGAERILGREDPAVLEFQTRAPSVKSVRDMLTHFDKYIEGDGHLQRSGRRKPDTPPQPWMTLWGGDDKEAILVVVTTVGPDHDYRSYSVNVMSTLQAASDLVAAALTRAGFPESELLRRIRSP